MAPVPARAFNHGAEQAYYGRAEMRAQFTTRSCYGIRAMIAIAMHTGQGTACMLHDIAESEGCSPKYLGHVLAALTKAGLLKSRKGKGGGYCLRRPAFEITVKEIIRYSESALSCVPLRDGIEFFNDITVAPASEISKNIAEAVDVILATTTLQELVLNKQRKCSLLPGAGLAAVPADS
jgi:Rrf2 family protein